MKKSSLIFFLFTFVNVLSAQSYKDALGVRYGGGNFGVSYQRLIEGHWTVEGILQQRIKDRNNDLTIVALGELHNPVLSRRLNLYFGAGPQIQLLKTNGDTTLSNGLGIAGIVGLEFTIGRLNLSYDFKPCVYLFGGREDWESQSAISLRYVITKRVWKVDWSKLKFWEGWFKKDTSKK